MKKNSPLILYVIIILVILGGLSLFIFRNSILAALRERTGIDSAAKASDISATVVTIASSSALDINILKLPRFTALVNQVTNFNFDNICWRPDVVTAQLVASPAGENATSTGAAAGCVQGNSLPFKVKKK